MSSAKPLDELRRRLGNAPAPGAFAALAEEHRRAGRLDEAVAVCREGLARYPSYVSARVTLGRALLDLGDVAEATDELEQAVAQAPDNLAAVRALEMARTATDAPDPATAFGLPVPATLVSVDTDHAGQASQDQADPPAAAESSMAWLTADAIEAPWHIESPEPEAVVTVPEPPALAPTAWDETIYAPVQAFVAELSAADPGPGPSAVSAPLAVVGDDVMAFPAYCVETALPEPPSEAADIEALVASAAAAVDPLSLWTGLAEMPAQDDASGWSASLGAAVDEVFARAGHLDPFEARGPADPSEGSEPAEPAPHVVAVGSPVDPLRTLEAVLVAIRARRAALGTGNRDRLA